MNRYRITITGPNVEYYGETTEIDHQIFDGVAADTPEDAMRGLLNAGRLRLPATISVAVSSVRAATPR